MSKFLTKVKTTAVNGYSKVNYVTRQYAPEISLTFGLISFGATIFTASKAALECEDILKKHNERMEKIHETMELDADYANEASKRDLVRAYSATVVNFAKNYALTAAFGALSIGLIIESHKILNQRYLSATAAYTALSEVFRDYRGRVKEELGQDMDRHFRYGTDLQTIEETRKDENGKKVKETSVTESIDTSKINPSDVAVVFDETNPNWDPNPTFNLQWLKAREAMVNEMFQSRGKSAVMTLNEVYDMLDFPPTQEGAILGWVKGMGDDYIDFGLYNLELPGVRRFINGQDNFVLLDFNVDGIVWNKLPSHKELAI